MRKKDRDCICLCLVAGFSLSLCVCPSFASTRPPVRPPPPHQLKMLPHAGNMDSVQRRSSLVWISLTLASLCYCSPPFLCHTHTPHIHSLSLTHTHQHSGKWQCGSFASRVFSCTLLDSDRTNKIGVMVVLMDWVLTKLKACGTKSSSLSLTYTQVPPLTPPPPPQIKLQFQNVLAVTKNENLHP